MSSIYYRFGSERGIWRELNIDVDITGGLLVSDLKILVAEETNLSHEFARRTDLSLSLYDSSGSTIQLNDNCFVHPGERIIVNRIAWTNQPNIVHEASKELSAIEIPLPSPTQDNILPESLICSLCQSTMKKPVLVKCTLACGSSGCKKCVLHAMGKTDSSNDSSSLNDNSTLKTFNEKFSQVRGFDEKAATNVESNDTINEEKKTSNEKQLTRDATNEKKPTSAKPIIVDKNTKCPFCSKGYVTAITFNRRLQSLLRSLDVRVENRDVMMEDEDIDLNTAISDGVNGSDVDMDEDDSLPSFSYPSHYIYLLSNDLFNLVRNNGYIFISEGQSSWLGVYLDAEVDGSEANIIPISLVGGGTSYVIGGVFKLSTKCKVQLQYDDLAKEFVEEAVKLGVVTDGLSVYRINWVNKFLDTPMIPKRKQPFLTIMSNNTFKNNNEILSSNKVLFKECTEIAIDEPTFKLVIITINSNNPMIAKNTVKKTIKKLNWRDICYPGGPKPLPLNYGDSNPYVGYCHLLPFLSESQFKVIKRAQELIKIQFLKTFKTNVVKSYKTGKISKTVAGKLLSNMYDNLIT